MEMLSLEKELKENSYPGRGIVIGKTPNGKFAVTAYFIMGRSENIKKNNTIICSNPPCNVSCSEYDYVLWYKNFYY